MDGTLSCWTGPLPEAEAGFVCVLFRDGSDEVKLECDLDEIGGCTFKDGEPVIVGCVCPPDTVKDSWDVVVDVVC